MKFKVLVFFILTALVLAFVYQNSTPVMLEFVRWQYPVPLALLLLSVLIAGILLGMLLVLRRQSYNKKKKTEKESGQQPQAKKNTAAVATEKAPEPEPQDKAAATGEQTITQPTGEHHESNNSDYRGDSRVR
ncbi:MAG: lipopolysaccharide assembly protein LapA domain-containing protein [Pelovirga sp.]